MTYMGIVCEGTASMAQLGILLYILLARKWPVNGGISYHPQPIDANSSMQSPVLQLNKTHHSWSPQKSAPYSAMKIVCVFFPGTTAMRESVSVEEYPEIS